MRRARMGSSRSCDDEDGIDRRRVLQVLLLQGVVIMLLFILCGSVACLRWADRRGFTRCCLHHGGGGALVGSFSLLR